MGITVRGSTTPALPMPFGAAIVETKTDWKDDWEINPDLEVISFSAVASSHAASTCEILRRYGQSKFPFEEDLTSRSALNLAGQWIRISIVGEQGLVPQFVGIIESPTRKLSGNATIPAGMQAWIASGGLRLLQKMDISTARFLNNDKDHSLTTVSWVPPMNARDRHNTIVGNRSDNPDALGIYYYGGKSIWTHGQYLDYLVANFFQQVNSTSGDPDFGQPSGPVWTVGGQADLLDQFKTTIRFPEKCSAAEMLALLLPKKYCLDFFVRPTDDGFEITIFTPNATEESAYGFTVPANPNKFTIDKTAHIALKDVQLVETTERKVDVIEVIGKRIVVCGSLYGPRTLQSTGTRNFVNSGGGADGNGGTLVPKWGTLTMPDPDHPGETIPRPNSIEQDYIDAHGKALLATSDVLDNDAIRKADRYRDVYQLYGAPFDWTMDNGNWSLQFDGNGNLLNDSIAAAQLKEQFPGEGDPAPTYQTSIRETLGWLPLKEGFDYSVDPPTDNTISDGENQPTLKSILAWIIDEQTIPNQTPPDDPKYVQVDLAGVGSVHAPKNDWGIFLNPSPNHKVALNHWTSDQESTTDAELEYDYDTLAATIAIECDHRIRLAYTVPASMAAGDGSVMTIVDTEAECWVLLPSTALDVGADGTLTKSPDKLISLRSDLPRLGIALAGAKARYKNDRIRAALTFEGHIAYADLLGQILDVVQEGDVSSQVGGPITSVEWMSNPPQTIVKTGYA